MKQLLLTLNYWTLSMNNFADLFKELIKRVKQPTEMDAAAAFMEGAEYLDKGKKPVLKRMTVYVPELMHKDLKMKLLIDEVSFNALALEVISAYIKE